MQSYQGERQDQAFIQDGAAGQDYASLPPPVQYGCGQEAAEQQPGAQGQGAYEGHEPAGIAADAHQQVLDSP